MEDNIKKVDELIVFIARSLVDNPDSVKTTIEEEDDENVVITLSVDPEDMGKIIGKQGRIAKTIRTIVRAATSKSGKKYTVNIS